jgi:hypothetical protein
MSAASATGSRRRHHLAWSPLDGSRFSERPPFARLRSRRTSSDCADVARTDRVVSGRLRIRSCRHLAGGRGTPPATWSRDDAGVHAACSGSERSHSSSSTLETRSARSIRTAGRTPVLISL